MFSTAGSKHVVLNDLGPLLNIGIPHVYMPTERKQNAFSTKNMNKRAHKNSPDKHIWEINMHKTLSIKNNQKNEASFH